MSTYYRNRLLLLVATVVACVMFMTVGRWAGVPHEPGFEASISVGSASSAGRTVVVVLTLVAATAVATLVAGGVRVEAGLFAAAVGLAALSGRGGPMRYVLMHDELGAGRFRGLAVELLVLGVTIGALWATLRVLATRRVPLAEPSPLDGPEKASQARRGLQVGAFVVHVLVTGGAALLLLASDDKKQALIGIAAASVVGSIIASWMGPVPMGAWLWAGPVVVGLVGYAAAWLGFAAPDARLAPLLNAAPLDYAGAGVAGAIFGRWIGVSRDKSTDLVLDNRVRAVAPAP